MCRFPFAENRLLFDASVFAYLDTDKMHVRGTNIHHNVTVEKVL